MRNRDYKLSGQGWYYHIYNRGNDKQDVFLNQNDFDFFLLRLCQNLFPEKELANCGRIQPLPAGAFSLISYCLMPNHFHLLIRQNTEMPPAKLLLKICTSYSMYFNKKYGKIGHVFQDRYKQTLIDNNGYLIWLSAYIHQNPAVAGLIKNAVDYKWSSLGEYLDISNSKICDKSIVLSQFGSELTGTPLEKSSYKEFVNNSFEIIKQNRDLKDLLLDY